MKALLVVVCFAGLGLAQSADDSAKPLGDVACAQRAEKPATATKVYTNENMPHEGGISVVGSKSANAEFKQPTGSGDQRAIDAQWRRALDQQKAHIAELERQLAAAEEYERRSATRYPTGPNPRFEHYKSEVESLKQQIESAKKQLADLQDEARKAGANKAYD